jgi:hypothetical protein
MATQIKVEPGQLWYCEGQKRRVVITKISAYKSHCSALEIIPTPGRVWSYWAGLTATLGLPNGWGPWVYEGMDESFCPHDCCRKS